MSDWLTIPGDMILIRRSATTLTTTTTGGIVAPTGTRRARHLVTTSGGRWAGAVEHFLWGTSTDPRKSTTLSQTER